MPKNATTGRRHSGVNVLILCGAVVQHGFASQSWLIFRQALSLGGHDRRGERGITVVFAHRFTPDAERGHAGEQGDEACAIPFLKRLTVFNTNQCEGLPKEVSAMTPFVRRHDPAVDRGADPVQWHRPADRWQARLLRYVRRFYPCAAAAGLLRAGELAPHGAARTRPVKLTPLVPPWFRENCRNLRQQGYLALGRSFI